MLKFNGDLETGPQLRGFYSERKKDPAEARRIIIALAEQNTEALSMINVVYGLGAPEAPELTPEVIDAMKVDIIKSLALIGLLQSLSPSMRSFNFPDTRNIGAEVFEILDAHLSRDGLLEDEERAGNLATLYTCLIAQEKFPDVE